VVVDRAIQLHFQRLDAQVAGGPVIAYFDLDRTLIAGYSAVPLVLEWLRDDDRDVRGLAQEMLANIERRGGGRRFTELYRRLVKALAGTEISTLQDLGERAFSNSIQASLFREARELIRHHRQLGHRVVIISAATSFQVQPVARSLGADAFYSTNLQQRGSLITGEIDGVFCHGEGKVLAARKYARTQGASLADAWFYSDSRDDLPLLKQVGFPVATNPSPALAEYAQQHNWPILRFCSRGKASMESVLRTVLTANTVVTTAAAGAASWLLSRSPNQATNQMTRWLGDLGVAFAGLEFEIEGAAYLEAVRPAVFTFNHQSNLDSIVMAHLLRHDVVAFCKQELADNKLLGPLLRAHGTIFVDRDALDQSVCLQQAREALLAGKSLAIAPEGTRSATGELGEFKQGAYYLARKMRVPVVPVVLHNVADALPKGKLLVRSATIYVTVLAPIMPDQLGSLRDVGSRMRECYQSVLDAELAY